MKPSDAAPIVDRTRRSAGALGTIVLLLGVALAIMGARQMALGGSWYYVIAGIALTIAGVELVRGRVSGAWWFAAVLVGTVVWTLVEVGFDFWGFVPRLALLGALAIVLALVLPRLRGGAGSAVVRSIAVVLVLIFIGALAWEFVPHHVYRSDPTAPHDARRGE